MELGLQTSIRSLLTLKEVKLVGRSRREATRPRQKIGNTDQINQIELTMINLTRVIGFG